jgi:hypothetical protein
VLKTHTKQNKTKPKKKRKKTTQIGTYIELQFHEFVNKSKVDGLGFLHPLALSLIL